MREVDFDASCSEINEDSNASITSYSWDFGDGSAGSGKTTSHTYDSSGSYDVTLEIEDENGQKHTEVKTISVEECESPYSSPPVIKSCFTHDPTNFSYTVDFDADCSFSPVTITSYSWNFGDGSSGTGKTPSHTYNGIGPYDVTLDVQDSEGDVDTKTRSVSPISPCPPDTHCEDNCPDSITVVISNLAGYCDTADSCPCDVANGTWVLVPDDSGGYPCRWESNEPAGSSPAGAYLMQLFCNISEWKLEMYVSTCSSGCALGPIPWTTTNNITGCPPETGWVLDASNTKCDTSNLGMSLSY